MVSRKETNNEELHELEISEEETISDAYDLLKKLGVKVHTKTDNYNEDHTLSNMSMNERKFVREQTKLAGLIKDYIQDEKLAKITEKTLKTDIEGIIILSRAKEGLLLKALLEAVTGHKPTPIASPETEQKKGFLSRLFSKR